MSTREAPPPHNRDDPNLWAEDLIDYLVRLVNDLQQQLDDHESRITTLEP